MELLLNVLAQAAQPAQQPRGNLFTALLPLLAIFAIFYFILIVPQRRMQKKHAELVTALQKGDRVVTAGGLIGEIVAVKDDEVTLKTGSTTVVVQRQRVVGRYGEQPVAQ
jgi:preprotein translocase subunit YajC